MSDFKVPGDTSMMTVSDGDFGDDERTETESSREGGGGKRDGDGEEEMQHSSGGDEATVGTEQIHDNKPNIQIKKRHRRGKHKGGSKHAKKWQPYNKLSWEERKELDDRESKRATMKREERFLHGHPVAPYNTTQFLMDEHSKNENISPVVQNMMNNDSDISNSECSSMPPPEQDSSFENGVCRDLTADLRLKTNNNHGEDEDSFLANDFSETYENIHAERLQAMTKQELIQDYLDLEMKVEKLEKRVKDLEENQEKQMQLTCDELKEKVLFKSDNALLKLLKDEIEQLKDDNTKLRKDNLELRNSVGLTDKSADNKT